MDPMSRKYVCFIPTDPRVHPARESVQAVVAELLAAGIVQGNPADPSSLRNGPNYTSLFKDPDPRKLDDGFGCDPGKMVFKVHDGEIVGYAGDNLEPVACIYCTSELPYNCAQDAFWALRDGRPVDDPMMTMECYHCGKGNNALEADWGRSGGFAHVAFIFEGETSNRVEAVASGLEMISRTLGTPVRFFQVHSW